MCHNTTTNSIDDHEPVTIMPTAMTTQRPDRPDDALSKTVLITVDLEDWFQVENLRPAFPISKWDDCELRVERSTQLLLDLFDRHHVQATFFVLGWLADKTSNLIRTIHARGHEVASHGYNHQLCFNLSQEELYEDLRRSKSLLEDISGQRVVGYRAPNFSIEERLLTPLMELGYQYDSSYNSFALNKRHGKAKGLLNQPSKDHWVAVNGLAEVPISNLDLAGFTFPWGGGGYFRFYPTALYEAGVDRILRNNGVYVFYCHPWEVDAAQPHVNTIGAVARFRHYLNISKTLDRLNHFLTRFQNHRFTTCGTYINVV
jgi:polysaccharide deacetylase family protein (PEP-CTERM system associated)